MSSDPRGDGPGATSLWPFVAAAAVVLAVLAAVIGVALVGKAPAKRDTAERSASSGHAHDLVVHDGDTVSGQGEVLAVAGRPVLFCPLTPGEESVAADLTQNACAVAIDVTGVDLDRLSQRRASAGQVVGRAGLAGTYRHGALKVAVQSSYVAPTAGRTDQHVPCPAPHGGWPRRAGVDLAPAQSYALAHPGAIVEAAVARPATGAAVAVVLTAADPAAVRVALTPALGPNVCAARSRYTRAQLARAGAAMRAQPGEPKLNGVLVVGSSSLSAQGQPEVSVTVPVVSQSMADAVDAQPAGLVRLTAWLSPTS